jgi:transcriptional regulator with XRE-family HTH domain
LCLTTCDSSCYNIGMIDAHPLRLYRENHTPKLSQEGLAEKLGVARLTVLRWESGERKIDRTLVSEVSKKTGIPVQDLRPDLLTELRALLGGGRQ